MNNFVISFKRFITNKNVVTILGVLVVLVILFFGYTSSIKKETNPLNIPVASKKINATTQITKDDVTFNDKNQEVDYKVVIENTQKYDVKISNINLSTPTEEFLSFKVKETEGILESNSTKEIVVSFETTGIKGWGRNFSDELTANISFEKVAKQEEENFIPEE